MPDNVRGGSNDAALPLIATDDVSGVQFQIVKLDVGGNGVSTPASGTLPVSGTITSVAAIANPANSATLDALNETYTVDTAGAATVTFGLLSASSPSGMTLRFEGTVDGTNWSILYFPWDPNDTWIIEEDWGPFNPGEYRIVDCVPYRQVRAKLVAYVSGSITLAATVSAHVAARPVFATLFDKDQGNFATISNASLQVTGDVDSDSPDSGRPVKIGGYASAGVPASVADGDRVSGWFTQGGALNIALRDISGNDVAYEYGSGVASVVVGGGAAHDDVDAGEPPVKIGGKASSAMPVAVTDGDRVDAWFSLQGSQAVHLTDPNGNEAVISADGGLKVVGDKAHDGVDSGNPVKIGGYASLGVPTAVADGDRVNAWLSRHGSQNVILRDAAGVAVASGNPLAIDIASTSAGAIPAAGLAAHDDVDVGFPLKIGGKSKAAAPADVSADGDAVNAWFLRNGAQATVLTAAGALVGGDAANGLDVDVTRVPADPFGVNADAASATGSISAKLRFIAATGIPITGTVTVGSHAVTNAGTFAVQAASAGDTAHDAVDAGSPVKIGGKAGVAFPSAVLSGDRVDAWFGRSGEFVVAIGGTPLAAADATSNSAVTANSNLSGGSNALTVEGFNMLYNGSTWDRMRSGGVTGFAGVNGDTAHDAVDAGNPVKFGGYASSVQPTAVANGDRVNAWYTTNGAALVAPFAPGVGVGADAMSAPSWLHGSGSSFMGGGTGAMVYNGTNWDRVRGNTTGQSVIGGAAHDAPWAAGNQPVVLGAFASAAIPSAVSGDGDVAHLWAGNRGQLATMLVDASGNSVAVGGGTQYTEDAALGAVGAAIGTLTTGRAAAAAPTPVSADADAVGAWFLRSGQQVVSLAAGTALLGGDATGGLHAQGAIAHDGVDSGNPVKIGGVANSTAPTDVAAADRVNAWFLRNGALVQADVAPANFLTGQVTPTATAATLVAARPTRKYVTVYNNTNLTVYVGPTTVTTANGFPLPAGSSKQFETTALIQNIVASVTGLTGFMAYDEAYF